MFYSLSLYDTPPASPPHPPELVRQASDTIAVQFWTHRGKSRFAIIFLIFRVGLRYFIIYPPSLTSLAVRRGYSFGGVKGRSNASHYTSCRYS